MDSLMLVLQYLRITFKSVIQYRANFVSGVVGLALSSAFQLFGAIVVIGHFGDANGWNIGHISFMFGIWRIQYGVMLILFSPTWAMDRLIREGLVDRFLVRPRSLVLQLTGCWFNVSGVGQILFGVSLAVFGAVYSPPEWTWWTVPWIAVILVSGTVIQMALFLLMASLNFYHVRVDTAVRMIDRTGWQVNLFPASVYSLALQGVLTFGIPWAFMVFYPAHVIFDRTDEVFLANPVAYLAPAAAVVTAGVAWLAWRSGLRNYQGMGGM